MKKILLFLVGGLLFCINGFVFAITAVLPDDGGQKDVLSYTQVQGKDSNLLSLVKTINEYLWIGVGVLGLFLLAYSGFKLITAEGDKDQINSVYDMLIAAVIMIFVSVFSYAIVTILINLF